MTLQEATQKIKARELAIENDGNNEAYAEIEKINPKVHSEY